MVGWDQNKTKIVPDAGVSQAGVIPWLNFNTVHKRPRGTGSVGLSAYGRRLGSGDDVRLVGCAEQLQGVAGLLADTRVGVA